MSTGDIVWLDSDDGAGKQAVKDLNLFQANNNETFRNPRAFIGAAIGAISGAAASWSQAGIGLAGLLTGGGGDGDSLEIEVTNNSSQPIVLYNYNPASCNVSKVLEPIPQGESDTFLVDNSSGFEADKTEIKLQFYIGPTRLSITYKYTEEGDPGRWKIKAQLDEQTEHDFPEYLQLFGATFSVTSGEGKNFSFYTAPIETSTGQIYLQFYDLAN